MLSIFVYRDPLNARKLIAFGLIVVSLGSIAKIVVQTISMFYDFRGRPYL